MRQHNAFKSMSTTAAKNVLNDENLVEFNLNLKYPAAVVGAFFFERPSAGGTLFWSSHDKSLSWYRRKPIGNMLRICFTATLYCDDAIL